MLSVGVFSCTYMDYRSLPRISNSDLSDFHNHLFGIDRPKPVSAFDFGTLTHTLTLQPSVTPVIPEDINYALARTLATAFRADSTSRHILRFAKKEQVVTWEDATTNLPCKAMLDIYNPHRRTIYDLKTTSEKSFDGFLRSAEKYDYDRQAAFYLDAVGAKRFGFLIVQKVKPFHIWNVEYAAGSEFIELGRKKYSALLREWKRRADAGIPFVPSRWATRELVC